MRSESGGHRDHRDASCVHVTEEHCNEMQFLCASSKRNASFYTSESFFFFNCMNKVSPK